MARPSETGSQPTAQAPAGLGASRVDPARCDACGQFVSPRAILGGLGLIDFTPLNEFGPERIEFTCPSCANQEQPK